MTWAKSVHGRKTVAKAGRKLKGFGKPSLHGRKRGDHLLPQKDPWKNKDRLK